MQITDLRAGDIYRPKDERHGCLLAQVGEGSDVGFFRLASAVAVSLQDPLFRVVMSQSDFKKGWRRIGNFPLSKSLQELAWYGDSDIGHDQKYKVRINNVDHRVAVDEATYQALERLAVWETVHVIKRYEAA